MLHNRRHLSRQIVNPPLYTSLGLRRGGLLYNLSEGGLAVEVQGVPLSGQIVPVAFELPKTKSCVETIGHIAWRDKLGTRAGLEFLDLSEISRQQIKEWVSQRPLVGEHEGRVGQAEPSETPQFGMQQDIRRQDASAGKADLMVTEQQRGRPTSTEEHLFDSRPAVLQPRRASETRLREQEAAVRKEWRDRKNWEMTLEIRHAPGLVAGTVLLVGLMFILVYTLGQVQYYLQTGAVPPGNKETVRPAETSSPPVNAGPEISTPESPLTAPLIAPGTIVVQVAAVTQQSEAVALAAGLRKKDFPAFVLLPSTDQYYRVQVGPYADTDSAHAVLRRLKREGFKPIIKH